MSQSSAFMLKALVLCRKCKRKATEIHASVMKMALVAIMALEGEVSMLKMVRYRFGVEKKIDVEDQHIEQGDKTFVLGG